MHDVCIGSLHISMMHGCMHHVPYSQGNYATFNGIVRHLLTRKAESKLTRKRGSICNSLNAVRGAVSRRSYLRECPSVGKPSETSADSGGNTTNYRLSWKSRCVCGMERARWWYLMQFENLKLASKLLFAICYLPRATCYLLLACLLLATGSFLLATCYFLLVFIGQE